MLCDVSSLLLHRQGCSWAVAPTNKIPMDFLWSPRCQRVGQIYPRSNGVHRLHHHPRTAAVSNIQLKPKNNNAVTPGKCISNRENGSPPHDVATALLGRSLLLWSLIHHLLGSAEWKQEHDIQGEVKNWLKIGTRGEKFQAGFSSLQSQHNPSLGLQNGNFNFQPSIFRGKLLQQSRGEFFREIQLYGDLELINAIVQYLHTASCINVFLCFFFPDKLVVACKFWRCQTWWLRKR